MYADKFGLILTLKPRWNHHTFEAHPLFNVFVSSPFEAGFDCLRDDLEGKEPSSVLRVPNSSAPATAIDTDWESNKEVDTSTQCSPDTTLDPWPNQSEEDSSILAATLSRSLPSAEMDPAFVDPALVDFALATIIPKVIQQIPDTASNTLPHGRERLPPMPAATAVSPAFDERGTATLPHDVDSVMNRKLGCLTNTLDGNMDQRLMQDPSRGWILTLP